MKKYLLLPILLLTACFSNAQRLLSWSPEFPLDNSTVVITGDATKGNQGLLNYEGGSSNNVYVHTGVITNLSTGPTDWKYTKFTWATSDPAAHATPLGNNKYQFTITNPRTFFGVAAGETILKITFIFRNAAGTLKEVNSDGSDMYIPVYQAGQYAVRLNLPPSEPRFTPWLEPITATNVPVQGVASLASNLNLTYNGASIGSATSATSITGTAVVNSSCAQSIVVSGTSGATTKTDSANFYIAPATTVAALPTGAIEGINYDASNTAVTLVLYAPNKNHVVAIGDFSNWASQCSNQMKRTPDGNYYWLTLSGLTPGQEYGYQYVVDDTIKIADPYSQKILDPNNDPYIDAVTYPNLKPYPTGLTTDLVSVFQPAEPQYNWQVTNFTKPDKRNLMVYELLIRDFTAQHSYQALIDSIQYLKNTGINAIELMPVNEFDGNESWGYNPDFYFAPDKYYGPKNKLKQFVDLCHQNGIAVILDVVYNHCTGNAPEAKLYWNSATSAPAANNPWLNVSAPHPYGVFNDFNHTSTATQYLVERSLNHWINEYKIDGYRFDLAKGFTQTVSNTTTVENYDPSRVQNIERYYDNVIAAHPNTYMILEFLGTLPCAEEQEYAAHGLMLWGDDNYAASQCTMGYASSSDLSLLSYNSSQRNYNNPASVGYMESHDEERTMYRNLTFGNSSGGYSANSLPTALSREEAIASIFFTVPGPKMIWQFEERGYDISINYGGSNTANKPPHWEYMTDANRLHLYNAYHSIINFRLNNPNVFNNTTFSYDLYNSGGLYKLVQIADPVSTGAKVTVVANLDVTAKARSVTFQTTGTWTNYISNGTGTGVNGATGSTLNVTSTTQTITLQPGEYHIYYFAASCTTTAPTVTSTVTYCQNTTATALTATGTNLLWYASVTGGTGSATAPTPSTITPGSTTYYVSQTANGCEGPRAVITVTVNVTPAAPGVTAAVSYCQNAAASVLTATGTNLLWYTAATGGTGSSSAPTPSTATVGTTNFYVSQTTGVCESPRAVISITVNALPAAPGVVSPLTYCQNSTAAALTATGSNLLWYTSATGGTGTATAPIPSTSAVGSTTYYVSQMPGTCESPRASVTVNVVSVPAAPTGATPITYCQNTTATPLTATGTNLLWYTSATGGTGSSVAPTPSTAAAGTNIYYVSQTPATCESPRFAITVTVNPATIAPLVTTPVTYCQNTIASPLTANGTNLLWYAAATGGSGTSVAPTPSTSIAGTTVSYVSQTGNCGEGPRAAISVVINSLPAAPAVQTPVSYCQNAAPVQLIATGSNLLWYTTATGGASSATAPTPSTATAGSTTYYVSQTISTCEGPRAAVTVNVTAIPAAPQVSTPVTYCQNSTAAPLSATGTNLLWYTNATGGTGSATAPTPQTASIGSTNYYVSQSTNTCESPRALITVNITATTPAPTVTTPVNYCQGTAATQLTASGSNLLWYTTATGGVGSATAPTPNTSVAGSITYYVSQTQTCGESPRAAIVVNINALPAAPGVSSGVGYCQNTTAAPLTATGSNLLWYTSATGGTGSVTAPTPSTSVAGSTTYYVSQATPGCEGPRAAITVTITATPAAPAVSSPVTYCQNTTAAPLTATGSNLLWYTTATGGSGSATAPTPSTVTVGSTNYYVSQSTNTCEGPRALITVNITATTPAPAVTTPVTYCQNAAAAPLTAIGTSLLWYATGTGGTGTATAPTPSTATTGSTTYYVSQTLTCGEGPRAAIVVTVNAIPSSPVVSSPIAYCQNSAALPLTASGTNLLWYSTATGGSGSATAPTPSTAAAGSTTYYVSQTTTSCESPRAAIVVTVTATPVAPLVTSPVSYCQNTASSPLTATGTNLLWYTTVSGGTGSSVAPTPSTATVGTTNYYVSQSTNTCEGTRALITVNITASTPSPTVTTPINYCQNATATPLTAIGTGLLWYTTATGGTGAASAPTPSTTIVGSITYYVSQTLGCGEGPRAAIVVNVNAIPGAPSVSSPLAYCQNTVASPLTAGGSNLLWYTSATGGTGSATAPTPLTIAAGSTTYYVSQTTTSCEGPRAAIVVNVTATPSAPSVISPLTYCQNSTALQLSATGSNLLWYTSATGGTGSAIAPTPSTATVGSFNFYVSQSTNTCESPRALITVNITAGTPAPVVTSPVTYCQGVTASQLSAVGANLLWYASATGGTGSATAPTPSTAIAGSTIYYVSQSLTCGEGPRAAIMVTVNPTPAAPGVSGLSFCQGSTVAPLTATGATLLWYSASTGGVGTSTAPTPSTLTTGTTTYYVSQTTGTCEGPRAALVVTVNPTPGAPAATPAVSYCRNSTAAPLTATGSNLLWYNSATGGTGSATAPTPSTATVGTTIFYVSQTTGTCEGPRASITVTITDVPGAPVVSSTPFVYCENSAAAVLTATGNNLLWYSSATGGSGTSTAPVPLTLTPGTLQYYVSQSNGCGESVRAAITVSILPPPAIPTGLTASNITANSAVLSWNGTGGSFYTVQYRSSAASAWTTAVTAITGTTYTLGNLAPGVTYNWRVNANCDNVPGADFAMSDFTTPSRNNTIATITHGFGMKLSPNPVTSSAILDYIVPGNGTVTINVVNSLGQIVTQLYNGPQPAGQYQMDITNKISNLRGGGYFLRLQQNGGGCRLSFVHM